MLIEPSLLEYLPLPSCQQRRKASTANRQSISMCILEPTTTVDSPTSTTSIMANTSTPVPAGKTSALDPNKDCVRVTGLQPKRQAASTEDRASLKEPPLPSASQGEKANVTPSANNGNTSPVLNAVEPADISLDASKRKSRATAKSHCKGFVYDPAEGLTLQEQTKRYRKLGWKMATYDENRLKRIMHNQNSSYEDFLEAMYQLHTRFPKHKQGRAKNPWGRRK